MYQTRRRIPLWMPLQRLAAEHAPERWKYLCSNLGGNLEEARNIVCESFESHHSDPDLLRMCARIPVECPEMVPSLQVIVSRGVLNFIHGVTSLRDVEGSVVDLLLLNVNAYRVWRDSTFRMHDGIPRIISWIPHLSDLTTMRTILLHTTAEFPNYVFHCETFVPSMVYLTLRSHRFQESYLLDHIFQTHPTQCLVLMARSMHDDSFQMIVKILKSSLLPEVWMRVEQAWMDRLHDVASTEPVTMNECPITLMPMVRPCVASDGFTYEQSAIMDILARDMKSPMTREPLDVCVVPNKGMLKK